MIIKVKDLDRIKEKMFVGKQIVFKTDVWIDSLIPEAVKYTGTIKGKYPFGVEVEFNFNGKTRTRWLSYVDIVLAMANGSIPYSSSGKLRVCEIARNENNVCCY